MHSCARRYPCEKSAINPEHLRLFELAGRLFGRTVFEGIVADLPFANFCENCNCCMPAIWLDSSHNCSSIRAVVARHGCA